MKLKNIFLFSLCIQLLARATDDGMVIVTAADSNYFRHLLNFIGSVHYSNFDHLQELAVYDLGLDADQKAKLETIQKVRIHSLICTNDQMLQRFRVHDCGKMVPGWYSWKPVVVKQALDEFETIMYLDAGITVLKPLDDLFAHIREHGYFLVAVPHSIAWCTTRFVIDALRLHEPERRFILDDNTSALAAGIVGCNRSMYHDLIMPLYELSKDIRYFVDDGSAPNGFGTARHDQVLWSIYARLLQLEVKPYGWCTLQVEGKEIPFHTHWWKDSVNQSTTLYCSRFDLYLEESAARLGLPPFTGHGTGKPYFVDFIRYKN